jgi:translation elongation factor EF-G
MNGSCRSSALAFKEAARKACPIVLEPMMAVEIEVPEKLVDCRSEIVTADAAFGV